MGHKLYVSILTLPVLFFDRVATDGDFQTDFELNYDQNQTQSEYFYQNDELALDENGQLFLTLGNKGQLK